MKSLTVGILVLLMTGCATQELAEEQEVSPPKTDPITIDGVEYAYAPYKVVQPDLPARALKQRKGGHCIVEFTVNKLGETTDHSLFWSNNELYNESCLRAARLLRYTPLVVNGRPVSVTEVKYSYTFRFGEKKIK